MSDIRFRHLNADLPHHYHLILLIPLDEHEAVRPEWAYPIYFYASNIRVEGPMCFDRARTALADRFGGHQLVQCWKKDCTDGVNLNQIPPRRTQ